VNDELNEVPIHTLKKGALCRVSDTTMVLEVVEHLSGSSVVKEPGKAEPSRVSRNTMVVPISEDELKTLQPARSRRANSKGEETMQKDIKLKDGESKYNLIKDADVQAEFWKQVDKKGAKDCWAWKGRKTGDSGAFFVNNVELRVGKLAYLLAHPDADPDGRYTATVCRNAACCNAAHITPAGAKQTAPAPAKAAKTQPPAKSQKTAPASPPAKTGKAKAGSKAKAPDSKGKAASTQKGSPDTSNLTYPKPKDAKKGKSKAPVTTEAQ
jgi:hypothetical protein